MARLPLAELRKISREFPHVLHCEPPDVTGEGVWKVRGDLEPGIELVAEHANLLIALARFGTAYYKLQQTRGVLDNATTVR